MNPATPGRPRPRRPALFGPGAADELPGSPDPAQQVEAAHLTAEALVLHGRSSDDAERARLVALTDELGLDEVALLWSSRPADSLPGALWRLYGLRAGIRRNSVEVARAFAAGRVRAQVAEVVAGVAEPPGPDEVRDLADAVLTGAFAGDLDVALDRAASFCRVVSTGLAHLADEADEVDGPDEADGGEELVRRASDLLRTAGQLESAARHARAGTLL